MANDFDFQFHPAFQDGSQIPDPEVVHKYQNSYSGGPLGQFPVGGQSPLPLISWGKPLIVALIKLII